MDHQQLDNFLLSSYVLVSIALIAPYLDIIHLDVIRLDAIPGMNIMSEAVEADGPPQVGVPPQAHAHNNESHLVETPRARFSELDRLLGRKR